MLYLLNPRLCFFVALKRYLFVYNVDLWQVRGLSCEPNNHINVLYHLRDRVSMVREKSGENIFSWSGNRQGSFVIIQEA